MAFVSSEYTVYLASSAVVIMMPLVILYFAKKFPYNCNFIVSANNLLWCILISSVYIWSQQDISKACSDSLNDSSNCSYFFVIGGGFYSLHIALLIGTNFLLNLIMFTQRFG